MIRCCVLYDLSDSDKIALLNTVVVSITALILFLTLKAIKKTNEDNAKLNHIQSAENTIIKQIEFHYNILNGIKVKKYHYPENQRDDIGWWEEGSGQQAFEILYNTLKDNYIENHDKSDLIKSQEEEEKLIVISFQTLYNVYGSQFGNYFKNIYYLVQYIDKLSIKSEYIDEKEKIEYYINLIKGQLSKFEILLLAYDCIWIQTKPKGERFIDYAGKYGILSALEKKELIHSNTFDHNAIFKSYGINFEN